jgi:hypothetical protein
MLHIQTNRNINTLQLPALEPKEPQRIYERLLSQIPAECITIPIMLDCMVEQVSTETSSIVSSKYRYSCPDFILNIGQGCVYNGGIGSGLCWEDPQWELSWFKLCPRDSRHKMGETEFQPPWIRWCVKG